MHAALTELQLARTSRLRHAAIVIALHIVVHVQILSAMKGYSQLVLKGSGREHYLHSSQEIGLEIIPVLLVLEDGNNSVCEGSWVEGNSDVPLASLDLHAAAVLNKSQRIFMLLQPWAIRKGRSPPAKCQEAPQKLQGSCHGQQGVAAHISCHSQGYNAEGPWQTLVNKQLPNGRSANIRVSSSAKNIKLIKEAAQGKGCTHASVGFSSLVLQRTVYTISICTTSCEQGSSETRA